MSADAPESRPRHEDSDAYPQFIALIAAALALLVAAGLLVGWAFAKGEGGASAFRISSPFQEGPEARSDVDRAWADYERDTRAHLSGYGWIDRRSGVVTVPIDRAIDLVCAEESPKSTSPTGLRSAP